jgi:hypothetical protein
MGPNNNKKNRLMGQYLYFMRNYEKHPESFFVTQIRFADKSLARPGKTQVTATEDFEVHIFYL